MDKQFNQLRQTWDYLGEHDPLWAILSFPQKRGNRWQLEDFFATGRDEIGALLQAVSDRFPDVPRRCALDFGCGVGRLTRALAAHFDHVIEQVHAIVREAGGRVIQSEESNIAGDKWKSKLYFVRCG